MKTIKNKTSKEIRKVSDKEADEMVKSDWEFIKKTIWKKEIRDKNKASKPVSKPVKPVKPENSEASEATEKPKRYKKGNRDK